MKSHHSSQEPSRDQSESGPRSFLGFPPVKSALLFFAFALLAPVAIAQQPRNVQASTASATRDQITFDFKLGSGRTISFLSGSTLSLAGTVSGTPTGGTLDLSALTLTLPAGVALPSQTGHSGKYLTTNGTAASWATITGGGDLLAANNLSDLTSAATARTNLGLVIGTHVLAPSGSGASLTGLNATQLTSGTIPDARFPATLPAASGVNLTALNGSNIASGTVAAARIDSAIARTADLDTVAERTAAGIKSTTGGSPEVIEAHGNTGSTETFNLATANVHTATLDANCTFTLSGFTASVFCSGLIGITQDATGSRTVTWPAAVVTAPTLNATASSITWVSYWSLDGGTTIYASSDYSTAGAGDFSSNTSSSVDSELVLFSGTGGKTGKRGTGTGYVKVTSGVVGTPAATIPASEITGLPETWVIPIGDETTAITTGTAKVTWRAPYACTVVAVRASLTTVSSSGTPTFDINEGGTTILSTKLTIDASEKTSTTAASAAVISDTALADDAEITIDVDTAGTGAAGAKITIYVTRT